MEIHKKEIAEKEDLLLLARYNKRLLFGGGLIFSFLVIIVALFAASFEFNDFMEERRSIFQNKRTRILVEIETKQVIMMRGIIASELLWGQAHISQPAGVGRPGAMITGVSPVVLLEDKGDKPACRRYRDMLEELAYLANSSFLQDGRAISVYAFSPDGGFIGALLPQIPDEPERERMLLELQQQIAGLPKDKGVPLHSGQVRHPIWLPPTKSILTGEMSFQVVVSAFHRGKPFLTVVSDMPTQHIENLMQQGEDRSSFLIMDSQGSVALGVEPEGYSKADFFDIETSKFQGNLVSRYLLFKYGAVYKDGFFHYYSRISNTNMILLHVFSWKDAVFLKGKSFVYLILSLIFIVLFWCFLIYFYEKVFIPIYEKAKNVFDTEQLSRTIIAMAPYGLGLLDFKEKKMLLENSMMFKYKESAVLRGPVPGELLIGYFHRVYVEKYLGGGKSDYVPVSSEVVISNDGTIAELSMIMVKAKYQGRNVLLCGFADITAHKQVQRSLEDAKKAAEEANHEKSSFLAVMSHEIRTPLNAILGNLEILGRSILSMEQKTRLDIISNSSHSLLSLLNDVLDFSKVESGQMSVEMAGFDLKSVIRQVASIYKPLVTEAKIEFSLTIDDSLKSGYLGDAERIKQILNNLLSNALKFTKSGKIEVYASDRSGELNIKVSDTGIGIHHSQHAFIFDAFKQAGSEIATKFGGTGLGLTLCQRMAHLMGGEIRFSSVLGKGSIFELVLPAYHAQPASSAVAWEDGDVLLSEDEREDFSARILVVDDHPVNRMLLLDQLRIIGYEADSAEGGESALSMLAQLAYDLVLTDLQMPGMNGYVLAQHIRKDYPGIRVGAITANAGKHERDKCAKFGISDIIVKPASLKSIKEFIDRNIGKSGVCQVDALPARTSKISGYRDILVSTTQASLISLKKSLEKRDLVAVHREIHAMKGAFAVAGFNDIVQALDRISSLVNARDFRAVDGELVNFMDVLKDL
ncbi:MULTISPECIES: hybrid sensor histidine kinase/response regulator [Delftia]|uniref:hybrid sensor histidine kinase/response regulator n=1 Tax=Delftia TaxID=80865 RepID=UPI0003A925ED|nr:MULTISPECIES: hybrid sensor histidine kinase/response regulator [Delftia]MDH0423417.1 ATP-binding protein [Delftia tsuruhatensis]OJX23696.1 MAG: hybrid sensor histidine kinase/response regulator [Delftia sp. 67-8]QFS65383.1 response regulator [Delftia tsuruhatensis]TDF23910.1 sensor histidine kinase [Delftia tsuruhatensis]WON86961.1 ATP-binding protein [Delftia sp. UGAL515B_04]